MFEEYLFQSQISNIMFTSGDLQAPCPTSCIMIEDTLRGELVALAGKVVESAVLRESMTIEPDDFAFQLRNNKAKLTRLHDYLQKRYMIKNKVKLYDDTPVFTEPELELDDHNKPWKRRKICKRKFFPILQDKEKPSLLFLDTYDTLTWRRKVRADQISQALTIDSYEKFAEGRQVSFIKDTSLANLFTSSLPPHYTLSDSCGVVLAFLVQEMVQQLVEMAVLVQCDMLSAGCEYCTVEEHCMRPLLNGAMNTSPAHSAATSPQSVAPKCLQPLHITEALRRFYSSRGRDKLVIL